MHLARVGGDGGALLREVGAHVEHQGDEDRRHADVLDVRQRFACVVDEVRLDEVQVLTVDGHLVHRRDSGERGRGRADAVHLHMVGVAVDAAFVIDHERFGGLGPEDGGQPGCRLADVGGRE